MASEGPLLQVDGGKTGNFPDVRGTRECLAAHHLGKYFSQQIGLVRGQQPRYADDARALTGDHVYRVVAIELIQFLTDRTVQMPSKFLDKYAIAISQQGLPQLYR